MPHAGLGSDVEIRMNVILIALTSPIHHVEVHPSHGHYPPTIQTYVEGLQILPT